MNVMSMPGPDEQDLARQILEEHFGDWDPAELDDALRAVELDDEERER